MKAHDIMNRHVYKVKENDTVRSVIERFMDHRISGLPVINDRNEIVGYISDGDIMRYIGRKSDRVIGNFYYIAVMRDQEEMDVRVKQILNLNVLAIAKRKVITAQWDEDIDQIAAILGKRQIKKLPIERDGVLVGIISRGDVIRHVFRSVT
ncbi:CBS domain-containing protein [Paenibacillus phyllosphaerae]|uniref:CBS domain-containing protein n=1 Tax=Paenibacillus phyllosphaerae TaxID=274593 RepID=A0A7W5AU41_9BACL|nr:CBS domain-containing protein [Paenibacillus phyllosphaerae]MBB3108810.1 CBS domain-containing protein [Paenibacillus phyllosphaerae]